MYSFKTIVNSYRGALAGALVTGALLAATPSQSLAEDYPTRAVKIVVPYAPGGIPDVAGRVVAEKLSEYFKQPFIVENQAGAGGTIGTNVVAKAEPDGYTLLLGATGTLTIGPSLYKSLPFKQSDLAPVSLIGAFDYVMVTSPSLRDKSLADIVKMAKENPDKLNIASSGLGSEHHLLIEQFKALSGAPLTHVPYKGFGVGVTDVMADRVELIIGSASAAKPFIDSGKLGAPLAVTGSKRSALLPNTPTFTELGYPGMEMTTWVGLLAPAATPEPVLARLAAAMEDITKQPDFAARISGIIPMEPGPKAFAAKMEADTKFWHAIITTSKIPQIQ